MKHTKGPWQVSGCRFKWRQSHHDQMLDSHAVGPDSDPVCLVFYGDKGQHQEQLSNARLIAAAPELLEALQELVDAWPSDSLPPHAISMKVAVAINKATF